mmetsp:Transcript_42727/g.137747  ORF Transcript_42727/g.137747 Transcript_42727/m.137747 type:complete len:211 (-) Transcript_42727:545-1177(-)
MLQVVQIGAVCLIQLVNRVAAHLEGREDDSRRVVPKRHEGAESADDGDKAYGELLRDPRPQALQDARVPIHPRGLEGVTRHYVLALLKANPHKALPVLDVGVLMLLVASVGEDRLRETTRNQRGVRARGLPPFDKRGLVGGTAFVAVHLLVHRHVLDDGREAQRDLAPQPRGAVAAVFEGVDGSRGEAMPTVGQDAMWVQADEVPLVVVD